MADIKYRQDKQKRQTANTKRENMQTGQTENAVNTDSKCRQGRQKMQTGQTENADRADRKCSQGRQ